jgi:uncharacterized protein YjbI with pentapeptide repeats
MITQVTEKTKLDSSASYQLIQDEQLASVVITNQILAGSRVLLSSYQQVVFSDCVFYACEFQGVTFENCIFDNCSFEFSHFKKCKFKNCNFNNCSFTASSSINSSYDSCDMGVKLTEITMTGRNQVNCSHTEYFTIDTYIEMASVLAA